MWHVEANNGAVNFYIVLQIMNRSNLKVDICMWEMTVCLCVCFNMQACRKACN